MRERSLQDRAVPAWQLHRVRLGDDEIRGQWVVLSPDNTHHVRQVLRLREGARLRGLTPDGSDLLLRIQGEGGGRFRCVTEGTVPALPEPPFHVTVCQGLSRAERFEFVLQKGSELGAWEFYPVITARTVVRLDGLRSATRLNRWRRITEEASLQSGRAHAPPVHPVIWLSDLADLMAAEPRDLMLVPYEEEVASLRDLLRSRLAEMPPAGAAGGTAAGGAAGIAARKAATAAVVIGPEGGFEQREIMMLRAVGFLPVSLGPRILRTETAGPLVLSLLLYESGDLGGAGVER